MSEKERETPPPPAEAEDDTFAQRIDDEARRHLRARQRKDRAIWHGLGSFGMVGWSVVIPTLLGVLLGVWLDAAWPAAPVSWTLLLLVTGLAVGCVTAWQWVDRERRDIEAEREETE